MWLDGADSNSMTFGSGYNISTWADKSGKGGNATLGGATSPVFTPNAFSGRSAPVFTNSPMQTSATQLSSDNTMSSFVVFKSATPAQSYNMDFIYAVTNYAIFSLYLYPSGESLALTYNSSGPGTFMTPVTGRPTLVSVVSDGFTLSIYVNGAVVQARSLGTITTPPSVSTGWWIGQNTYTGSICEVLMYGSAMSPSQRQSIEGYLTWKWGTETIPQALTVPGVSPGNVLAGIPTDIPGCQLWLDGADAQTITFVPPSTASSYFRFDGSTTDQSNAITLTTTGSVSYVTGQNGQAVFLANAANASGSNFSTNYLTASYTFPTTFTVAFWFNSTISTSAYKGSIIFMTNNNPSGFVANAVGVYFSGGNLGCAFDDIVNNGTSYPITSGTWYHAAITYNGGSLTLYVNGVKSGNTITGTGVLNAGFMLGCGRDSSGPYPFAGYIDDFRIFTSVLSVSQIFDIYTSSTASVSAWADKSGKGYNAVVSTGTNATAPTYLPSTKGIQFTAGNFNNGSTAVGNGLTIPQGFGNAFVGTTFSIFAVALRGANQIADLLAGFSASENNNLFFEISGSSLLVNEYAVGLNGAITAYSSPDPAGIYNVTATVGQFAGFSNGTSVGTANVTTTLSSFTSPEIGRRYGSGPNTTYSSMTVFEMIAFVPALSTAQRQQVEGYLANKWGISVATPGSIKGLSLWLDGADPAGNGTIPANGATVSTWVDKSGYGNNATGGVSPTYSSSARAVLFNGSSMYLQTPVTAVPTNETVFVVFTPTVLPTVTNTFNCILGASANNGRDFNVATNTSSGSTAYRLHYDSWAVGNIILASYGAITYNILTLATGQYTGGQGAGSTYGSSFGAFQSLSFSGSATTRIGAGNGGDYFTGTINEVLIYNTVLNTTQRQQVEAYLATKWGIPLGGGYTPLLSSPANVPGCALWLDGADSSSTSNITTGTWYDKSGLSRTATSNSGGSAFSMGTINSLPAVTFPSGSATAFIAQAPITLSSTVGFSIFFVARWTAGSSDRVRFFCTQFSAGGTLDIELVGSNAAFPTTADLYGGTTSAGADLYGFTIPSNTPFVYSTVFTSTAANGYSHWLNGVSGGSQTPAGAGTVNGMVIGNYTVPGAAYAFIGQMGEFLMFSNALNTTQRQAVERYLSLKWGLSNVYTSVPGSISGLSLWLDGADVSTFTFSSGSNIASWRDKASGLLASNSTASNQPSFVPSSQNGNGTVFFDATAGLKRLDLPAFSFGTTSRSAFFVMKNIASANYNGSVLGGYPHFFWDRASGNNANVWTPVGWVQLRVADASGNLGYYTYYLPLNEYIIYEIVYSSSTIRTYQTGTLIQTIPTISAMYDATNGYSLGGLNNGDDSAPYPYRLYGNIAEVILFNTALNTDQRQTIESYLAKKWGLVVPTQTLPVAHPFRSIKPYARRFSPIDIPGCKLWLDAYDDVTFTYSSGVIIQTWADKSGNGYNATQYGTGTTTYSATGLNSRPAVMFSASTTNMVCSIPAGTFPNGVTGFVVLAATNGTGAGVISRSQTNIPSPFDIASGRTHVFGNGSAYKLWDSTYTVGSTSSAFIYDFTIATDLVFTETVNGSAQTITFNYDSGGAAYGDNGTTLTIGTRQDRSWYTTGSYSEVILFDTVLTASQRQQVDGYLAKKWNLQGNLPGTHSFATIPPTSALPFTPNTLPGCQLWLDAADASTVTGTTTVTAWKDKSGNGRNLGVGSGTTVYANNSITITNSYMFVTSAVDLTAFTFFIVAKSNTATNNQTVFGARPNTSYDYNSSDGFSFFMDYQSSIRFYGNSAGLSSFSAATSTPKVFSFTSGSGVINARLNGTAVSGASGLAARSNTAQGFAIGASWNGSSYDNIVSTASIYEIIVYNASLTTSQCQQVEGYLANKWGFQGSLPVAHPYYKIQPALRGQSIDFYESFENPAIPAPYSWAYSPSWNNWIWGGGGISGAGGSPWDSSPRVAAKGTRFAYIQGHSSYIQRAITPIPGYVATLSFSYSYRNETGRNSTFGVNVYAGGVLVGYFPVPNSFTAWTTVTATYTMTSTSTNIQFMTYDPSGGDHSILVDNISLT